MNKIWLEHYPKGVPAEIDTSEYRSIADLFHQCVGKFRDLPAYSNFGKTITYDDLDRMSRDFAAYLSSELGLKKGDRVAIMMPNLLQYPIVLFGILRAGLVVVNTNPLYTERELEHQLTDAGCEAIIILENFAHTLEKVLPKTAIKTVITTRIGDMLDFPKSMLINFVIKHIKKMVPAFNLPKAVALKEVLKKGSQLPHQDAELEHEDIAFLQYTGGTTGVAKGAVLTHKNMVANLLQAHAWAAADLKEGKETIITALPLYHIFSLTANALFSMKMGANSVLITNPRDYAGFIKELRKVNFSYITGVNTLFNKLLNTPGFDQLDFSHLKVTLGSGMAVQRAVADEWNKITGVPLIEAYGLTETSPAACVNPLDIAEYTGMIGQPISSTEVSIRDDDGNHVALGERGELWIRGPQVMRGYWKRPEETAKVLTDDGWLKTGDVAIMNEAGSCKIVDRIKDMIIVSGFNVYPNEIEDVIALHPKVLEVGVIGILDETCGEAVKVFAVKKDASLNEAELIAYCKENLTAYKRPKIIVFIDELPKTNIGKVLRRELRDM
ncbi:MAG TPA: long-chain-fatty-acid--CoA ligase [Leucothrix mucor]|nr:long-chain-fatty-acid--CoA ligase [Leucothrix mucor]